MIWLVFGVVLWSSIHLLRGVAEPVRRAFISAVGPGPYKGIFFLLIVASLVLMVVGWRATAPVLLYPPPSRAAALLLMLLALILFAASGVPTNIKRFIRHPQLAGVVTWTVAHLLANGDTRSVVLFGGIGLWALIEMPIISRREGAWQKPPPLPLSAEVKPLVGGVIGYVILLLAHPYLFNVSPI